MFLSKQKFYKEANTLWTTEQLDSEPGDKTSIHKWNVHKHCSRAENDSVIALKFQ